MANPFMKKFRLLSKIKLFSARLAGDRSVELARIFSIAFATLGTLLFIYFFRFVDAGVSINLVYAAVAFLSLGNILGFLSINDKSRVIHFVYVLFLTSLILSLIYDLRFPLLQGSDILYEYKTARKTLEQGGWFLNRTSELYFSSISVSVLPAIVAQVTGLDLLLVFKFLIRLPLAILPLAVFLATKEVFDDVKKAALSAIIFSQIYFNFMLLPQLARQTFAELFLVLIIFQLIKQSRVDQQANKAANSILVLVLAFGLVSSHYLTSYWSTLLFASVLVLTPLLALFPRRLQSLFKLPRTIRPTFNTSLVLMFFVLVSSWTIFAYLPQIVKNIEYEVYIITNLMGRSAQYEYSWITGSSLAGSIVTYWIEFVAILAPLGFLYYMLKVTKESKQIPWAICCFVSFILMGIWLTPLFKALIYMDRVYMYGTIFFTSFIAMPFFAVSKKNKIVMILISIFLIANLPINMLLPSHQTYAIYHNEASINPPEAALIQDIIREPANTVSSWFDLYTPPYSSVYADTPTGSRSLFSMHRPVIGLGNPPPRVPEAENGTFYFFLHHYNTRYGLWELGESRTIPFDFNKALNNSVVFYNNGNSLVLSYYKKPQ